MRRPPRAAPPPMGRRVVVAAAALFGASSGGNSTFGNMFCFGDDERQTFELCCGDRDAGKSCWTGPFTYEACCYTSRASWHAYGTRAWAHVNIVTGRLWQRSGRSLLDDLQSQCARTAFRAKSVWPTLGAALAAGAGGASAAGLPGACLRTEGGDIGIASAVVSVTCPDFLSIGCEAANATAVVLWANGDRLDRTRFEFCAPAGCWPEELAGEVVPVAFAWGLQGLNYPAVVQSVDVEFHDARAVAHQIRVGRWGRAAAPASVQDLDEYSKSFMVCGRCELETYGGLIDGGYKMCRVGLGVVAAYSYGIDGKDAWGEAVSQASGAVVHQYDCVNTRRPACERPPCKFVFHEECLTANRSHLLAAERRSYARHVPWPSRSLGEQLRENGHGELGDARLLMKVDIEGSEWDVFSDLDGRLLRKFLQIAVEFHHERPFNRLTDAWHLALQLSAVRRLLELFVVVHVAGNRRCGPGACLEVTFANRDFVEAVECHQPPELLIDW